MRYPLREKIGDPDLLVGRALEFQNFGKWIAFIPKMLSQSRVILARRKSGKTAFVQRIFNQLWSADGAVIPFFLDIAENKIWLPNFAIKYFRTFASQYISFLERDEALVSNLLSLEEIRTYGKSKSIGPLMKDADYLLQERKRGDQGQDLMWDMAYTAPHRYAAVFDQRFLVILDEFQHLSQYIYRDKECKVSHDETIPGSFHSLSESKIAPMLVTGSYVRWLINISSQYLQAGRLLEWYMKPYLLPDEGLQAVYKYAKVLHESITNDTAILINRLCMSDPFFISCVMKSNFPNRDLTHVQGVADTVNYEITDRRSQMQRTWGEYIEITLQRINDIHAKNILLYLSKFSEQDWTLTELRDALQLPISINAIHRRLRLLVESDVIREGSSDIRYQGLGDGVLSLILRNRFEEEISSHPPDLKKEFEAEIKQLRQDKRSIQGMLNNVTGQLAEYQLAYDFRARRQFALSVYFEGVRDLTVLDIVRVNIRVLFKHDVDKMIEFDVIAESDCGRVVIAEVKKRVQKTGVKIIREFLAKVDNYKTGVSKLKVLPVVLSLGGFTPQALALCREHGVGVAEKINYYDAVG